MAHDVDVRSSAVDVGVDDESRGVNLGLCALDIFAVLVDSDEVGDSHHTEVAGVGVCKWRLCQCWLYNTYSFILSESPQWKQNVLFLV